MSTRGLVGFRRDAHLYDADIHSALKATGSQRSLISDSEDEQVLKYQDEQMSMTHGHRRGGTVLIAWQRRLQR